MKGIKILPNPPINKGIIIKKIINIPWKVIIVLYWTEEQIINPGKPNSNLIIIDNPKPKEPPIQPAIIYTPPIKIWFVVIRIWFNDKTWNIWFYIDFSYDNYNNKYNNYNNRTN